MFIFVLIPFGKYEHPSSLSDVYYLLSVMFTHNDSINDKYSTKVHMPLNTETKTKQWNKYDLST